MVRAAYLTTSLMVSAWHLLRDRIGAAALQMFSTAMRMAAIIPDPNFAGDAHRLNSVPHDEQPSVAVLFYSFCVMGGAAILMPIIRAYTAHTYWVFRGRMKLSQGRH